jgi:hypothetical protein
MVRWQVFLYVAFATSLSWLCFLRPADNLDRFIYEALVRGNDQPVETVYPIVKHESPRAEASSVLDSAVHLGQLQPLYAIKPVYVEAISIFSKTGIPLQKSISLISALSLLGIAAILLVWTKRPLYCALLISTPGVLSSARLGTPDALSALITVGAFLALVRNSLFWALLLLLISVWVRTDNLLVAIFATGWLLWERRLTSIQGGIVVATALGSVLMMNHLAGNYSWAILFRYSFIGGRSPAEIPAYIGIRDFSRVFAANCQVIAPQLAIGILLGAVAWRRQQNQRPMLLVVALSAFSHFVLFPSPEIRYFVWAYLLSGVAFIAAMETATFATDNRG